MLKSASNVCCASDFDSGLTCIKTFADFYVESDIRANRLNWMRRSFKVGAILFVALQFASVSARRAVRKLRSYQDL